MADDQTFVTMLVVSGQGGDTQWFDYRTTFFGDIMRVEWDKGTMSAALPNDIAHYLLNNGYARLMSDQEIEAYTEPQPATPPVPPAPKQPKPKGGSP